MSRPIKLSNKFQEFQFLEYYKENRSKPYIYRCLALHHIQRGCSYEQVSEYICYGRVSIMQWVRIFEDGGLAELLTIKAGRGKKAKLATIVKPLEIYE